MLKEHNKALVSNQDSLKMFLKNRTQSCKNSYLYSFNRHSDAFDAFMKLINSYDDQFQHGRSVYHYDDDSGCVHYHLVNIRRLDVSDSGYLVKITYISAHLADKDKDIDLNYQYAYFRADELSNFRDRIMAFIDNNDDMFGAHVQTDILKKYINREVAACIA